MPEFPNPPPELTQDRALSLILSSIAYEELALSHILNAEGEKIQYILGSGCQTSGTPEPEGVLAVNKSVSNLLEMVLQNQLILKNKMDRVLEFLPRPQPPPAPPPCPPQPPPCPPQPPWSCGGCPVCLRKAAVPGPYCTGEALRWMPIPPCPCGAEEGGSDPRRIPLPWTGPWKIQYFFELQTAGNRREPEVLELRGLCPEGRTVSRPICALTNQRHTVASGEFVLSCPRPPCSLLWVVTPPGGLKLWQGGLSCLPMIRQSPADPDIP